MKIRAGYVSNSSSSSLLILIPEDKEIVKELWKAFFTKEVFKEAISGFGNRDDEYMDAYNHFLKELDDKEPANYIYPLFQEVLYSIYSSAEEGSFAQDYYKNKLKEHIRKLSNMKFKSKKMLDLIGLIKKLDEDVCTEEEIKEIQSWDIRAMEDDIVEEVKKEFKGLHNLEFASDNGSFKEACVRFVLFDFYTYCVGKGLNVVFHNNS